MLITIPSFTIPNWQHGGATAKLRIRANDDFVASDGTIVSRNYARPETFYKEIDCTVSGTTITVPQFTIDSTTDSSVRNATYTGVLYDANDRRRLSYFSGYKIPSSFGSTALWSQIAIYNGGQQIVLPDAYMTTEEAAALITVSLGAKQDLLVSGTNIKTINTSSVLGSGNLKVSDKLLLSNYASLAAAVTAIGATPAIVQLDTNATVSTTLVILSTLILEPLKGATITKSGSGTIEFQGIGLAEPYESQLPLFVGFAAGDITWTGSIYPKRLSVDLWSSADVMAKITRATAAMTGKIATLVATPGNFASRSTLKTGHSLHLTAGDYTSSVADVNQVLLYLESDTVVYGDGMTATKLFGPTAVSCDRVFAASGMNTVGLDGYNENIEVRDLLIVNSDPVKSYPDTGASAILLGNCTNGHVRRVGIKDYPTYGVYIGGFPTAGFAPNGCSITECVFDNCRGQNVGFLNGKNITIRNNMFRNIQLDASGAFIAVIDIEPNSEDEIAENLTITDNLIDCRTAQQFCNAIVVQSGGNTVGCVNGIIANNLIIGPTTAKMSNGILVSGVKNYLVADNYIKNSGQTGLSVYGSRSSVIQDNGLYDNGSGGTPAAASFYSAEIIWKGNSLTISSAGSATDQNLTETETTWLFNSTGSTLERRSNGVYSGATFLDFFKGLTINLNGSTYTITAVTDSAILELSPSPGTLVFKTLASATDIDAVTDTFTSTAHGFQNGCKLRYEAGTVAVGGLTTLTDYYVVNRTADTFQLSATLGGSAINLSSTGTGNQLFHPVATSIFSSNEYVNNRIPIGINLSSTGSSRIISDALRRVHDTYTPAQITSDQNDYKPLKPFAHRFNLSTDASRNITGWVSVGAFPDYYVPAAGEHHEIYNAGSFNIVLQNENAGSVATGRFKTGTGADITLLPGEIADMEYSSILSRWMVWKRVTNKTDVGLSNVDNTSDATKNAAAVTLTNKRITPRVGTTASSATPTPVGDSNDLYTITALAAAAELQAPSGTPTNGQRITVRLKDDGTGRALTYAAIYRAVGVTLPTTTVANKTIYLEMIYNDADAKWDIIKVAEEA